MKKETIESIDVRSHYRKATGEVYPNGRPVYKKCANNELGAELAADIIITLSNGRTIIRNGTAFQNDCKRVELFTNLSTAKLVLVGSSIDVTKLEESTAVNKDGNEILTYDSLNIDGLTIQLSEKLTDRIIDGKLPVNHTSDWEIEALQRVATTNGSEERASTIANLRKMFNTGTTVPANDDTNPTKGKVADKAKAALESALTE